ncbi:MAG: bifunctional phosphopantothenoylcysteine decarboxylase/phosphopantothenate--cysteine ligase CoaBC [Devosiaceae bacterium]|nr:bifunctional phosphopantothenoylcysteine decarboxylase/phosphopantothenate--cysteine ligase CoaBC [Devosiaceae bacterium MH13]
MLIDQTLAGKAILLVITGGIAAYKTPDLVRRMRERGATVRVIMTEGAQGFITPLTLGAVSGQPVFTALWDRDAEHDIGHVRLAREADLIIVAPASADFLAKMAGGLADDLASTVMLAADAPVLAAPAMNPKMWTHPATQRNVATLRGDGIQFIGPEVGEMAESGEAGLGRMSEPMDIAIAAEQHFATPREEGPLWGKHVLITAGPTHEPIDPVRLIVNRSSGKQGYALAQAAHRAGATVTLVSGPTSLEAPAGVTLKPVQTARQMLAAVEDSLPADIGIFAAAVADWRVADASDAKIKKDGSGQPPTLRLTENPDILATIATSDKRPKLLMGFAAETNDVEANAIAKLAHKGCDYIVANDVSPKSGVMGGDANTVSVVTGSGVERWPTMGKADVAEKLVARLAADLKADLRSTDG